MLADALSKRWDARSSGAPLHRQMAFDGDELVLGAGTKLAAAGDESWRAKADEPPTGDARIVALLSAAYRRPIELSALAHIRCALVRRQQGEMALALTHLALTGLPGLANPKEDARRLFMADGLMKAGVAPAVIVEALGLGRAPLDDLERGYNPDQPRVPAGNGRESGQWTSGNAPSASTAGEAKKPAFNGRGPNDQHQRRVVEAQTDYVARGFKIASASPVSVNIPGFPTPRIYDFVAQNPITNELIGVEVKTTQYDAIYLNASQVDKDAALLEAQGVLVPSLGAKITLIAYETYCGGCWYINLRTAYLVAKLLSAGVTIKYHPFAGGGPPI
jgi:hypothetical protein